MAVASDQSSIPPTLPGVTAHPLAPVLTEDPTIRALLGSASLRTHAVAPRPLHIPLVHALVDSADHPDVVLVITASSRESDQVRAALSDLEGDRAQVWELPAWETLPHERLSPHPETVARRLSVIRALSSRDSASGTPLVVVASVRALIQPVSNQLADTPPGWSCARVRLTEGSNPGPGH